MSSSFLARSRASKRFSPKVPVPVVSTIALALAGNAITVSPASAVVAGIGTLQNQLKEASPLVEVVVRRGGMARRTTVVGPRATLGALVARSRRVLPSVSLRRRRQQRGPVPPCCRLLLVLH